MIYTIKNQNTGLMDNGFAATISASKTSGEGYVDGTQFDGYNYFVNFSKEINENHKLSFTTFGAPQRHGQRQNRSTIETYRNAESGNRFNPDWGYKNGQVTHIEDNFYHKSQTSLNHYWTINDRSNLSTAVYASFGTGGGGGTAGENRDLFKNRIGGSDQPVDLDAIVEINRNRGALGSEAYLRASRNDHEWYGVLSTYKNDLTENLSLVGGVDLREYTGIHFSEVTDLLGGDYALDDADVNNPNRALKVGDKRDYHNDGNVGWQGFFAQLEYDNDNISAFFSTAVSNTSYQRVDYFNYLDSDALQSTDTYNFLGYSSKGGINYRIDDTHNVFGNIGYFEKAAGFDAVFQNFDNENINPDAENQKIFSVELGYGFRSEKFAANVNVYRTEWKDRTFTDFYTDRNAGSATFGQDFAFNLQGVNALHQGIEFDFNYKPSDKLTITGMASIADWSWTDNVLDVPVFNDAQENIATIDLYIKDLKVGDAAQTTAALGLNYKFWDKTSFNLDYNFYGNLYSDYDPNDRTDATKEGVQPWKVPNYSLLDASLRHGFQIGGLDTTITGRMNNVFNTAYISDALDGTAQSALVWYGFGRTFSLSAKINF